jgi:hypothetical protein
MRKQPCRVYFGGISEVKKIGFVAIRPIGGVGAMYDFLKSQWLSRDPVLYPGLLQQGRPDPITWSSGKEIS